MLNQPAAIFIDGPKVDVTCFGGNDGSVDLTMTGGTTPYAVTWNNGAITEDIDGLSAGIYDVVVTDANDCTASYEIEISEREELTGSAVIDDVDCNGGDNGKINFDANGGKSPYTYAWSNG